MVLSSPRKGHCFGYLDVFLFELPMTGNNIRRRIGWKRLAFHSTLSKLTEGWMLQQTIKDIGFVKDLALETEVITA